MPQTNRARAGLAGGKAQRLLGYLATHAGHGCKLPCAKLKLLNILIFSQGHMYKKQQLWDDGICILNYMAVLSLGRLIVSANMRRPGSSSSQHRRKIPTSCWWQVQSEQCRNAVDAVSKPCEKSRLSNVTLPATQACRCPSRDLREKECLCRV